MYVAEIAYRQQRITERFRNSTPSRVLPKLVRRHHRVPVNHDRRG
jgi:hypothetical protein